MDLGILCDKLHIHICVYLLYGIGCNFRAIGPISKVLDVLKTLELSPKLMLIRFMLQWILRSGSVAN